MKVDRAELYEFINESNRIERIYRDATKEEILASAAFLEDPEGPTISTIVNLAKVYCGEGNADLRYSPGMNVMVGSHAPPPGGPWIRSQLEDILADAELENVSPFLAHAAYETLHPLMDGNGRTGRMLWAWMMLHHKRITSLKYGFLHLWYYQSLDYYQEVNK